MNLKANKLFKMKEITLGTLLLSGVIAYYLFFGQQGIFNYLINMSQPSRRWLTALSLRYLLGIVRDMAIIYALGLFVTHRNRVGDALHYWLLAWIGGFLILIYPIAVTDKVQYTAIFDQAFFLTRGSLTVLAGVFWFLLFKEYLLRWVQPKWGWILFGIFVSLPQVFNRDLFAFSGGEGIAAIIVLGCFSLAVFKLNTRFSLKWLFVVPVALFLTVGIAYFDLKGGWQIYTASRFIGLASPLTLFPAATLLKHIVTNNFTDKKHSAFASSWWLPLSIILGVVLMNGGSYPALVAKSYPTFKLLFQSLGFFWVIPTIVFFAGLVVIAACLSVLLSRNLKVWENMTKYWNLSLAQSVIQLSQIRKLGSRLWKDYHRSIIVVGVLYCAQTFSALILNQSIHSVEYITHPNLNVFALTLGPLMPRMIAGTLVLGAAYTLLLAISNRYWFSLISVTTVTILFAFANLLKIKLRSAPIVVADLKELSNFSELIRMINPITVLGAVLGIIIIILLIILIERRSSSAQQKLLTRVIKFIISLSAILSLGFLNHPWSFTRNALTALSVNLSDNNQIRFAQWDGPILQFVTGFDVKAMSAPSGYSKANIQKIVLRYRREAKKINQTRVNTTDNTTVVFNLSESFSDPTRVPGLQFNDDPIPYIHKLQQETTSGYMMSFGYGGGTADMEYMTLTGTSLGTFDTSLNTPYTQLVPQLKSAPNIGNLFGYASAIHPYTGGFYNRPEVYRKFKFNKFAYLDSKYKIIDQQKLGKSIYLSDKTAYTNALAQIKSRKKGQFINLISIQNHLPYSSWYPNSSIKITKNSATKDTASVQTFAQGTNYTDQAVKVFKEALDKLNKPVIWVFYGDHLPGIYPELATDSILQHKTDYFVYANKYAREHHALTKISGNNFVGSDSFIALALQQGNIKVNPYTAILTKVQQNLPAQWMKTDDSLTDSTEGVNFVTDKGTNLTYSELTFKQKCLYHDYQLLQYDINVGKQYSLADGLMNK